MRVQNILPALALPLVVACGGSAPSPESPSEATEASDEAEHSEKSGKPSSDETAESADEAPDEEPEPAGMPTRCKPTRTEGVCVPNKKFVEKLCMDVYPNVALVMFRGGSPWTRGYLTRKTKAWNASGGASTNDELVFDEEVLVLRYRAPPKGGVQISGAGGYDVLRWDGSCVTLGMDELRMEKPPSPKTATVRWKYLDEGVRKALRENEAITEAYRAQKKECKGVTIGDVSKKCVQKVEKLGALIIGYVRDGGELPEPARMPE